MVVRVHEKQFQPRSQTGERGGPLGRDMRRRLVMSLLAALSSGACADRTIAEAGEDPEVDPGEQPSAAGALYSPCTNSSECPELLCVFPSGEAGFCSAPCETADDPGRCEPTPGDQPATCLDIGLPVTACALDCEDAPCPVGMRCERVMSGGDERSICF